ncbi:MAG: hypothetical protein QNJ77_01010 [Acidimicrobiia bacterium]|nr:hypothetical protein [Acidimicrobiia bacterium]
MRFLKSVLGGIIGAIPGIALIPVLEFFAIVLIFAGMVTGAMMAWAPRGRRLWTAYGVVLGFLAAGVLAMIPGFGILLAPAAIIYGGWYGMNRMGDGTTPAAQP